MKSILKIVTAAFMVCSLTYSYSQPKKSSTVKEVPVIDRAIFFGNPEIAGGQLSPDGNYVSFTKAYNGILNIWVKKFDEPFDKARRLTNLERPAGGYFWSHDGKYILYVKDKGGNENYNIYAVSPSAAFADTALPQSRNITPNDKARALIYMVSKINPDIMMVGLNDRDDKWHDLYKLEISTGKLTKLRENKDRISSWIFDWNEKPRLALRSPEDGSTEILSVTGDSLKKVYDCGPLESVSPAAFTKDNSMIYVTTNKGAEVNLEKLVLMNPQTGATTDVEKDPLNRVDIQSVNFSDVTHQLQFTSYYDDKERRYFKDKKLEADFKFVQSKFPGKEVIPASNTSDEQKLLIAVTSDHAPSEVFFFDRQTRKLVYQYTPRPKLKPYEPYLSPMKAIRYTSSDGLEIPAYLTLPAGVTEAKNLPLLVVPHGGPWSRDYWGFNPIAQMMSNRGFAVLSPNFRGSTGYGKKFLDAGNLQWGKLMQDDITWGVKYLVSKGIADPKKVAILGGSYGGYATLAGLAFTPDVYACGVSIVGPSNLFTLMNSIPPYWEAARKVFALRMGDETSENGKVVLREASPLFSADKIKAPLLIVQGANDPRVNKAESEQIVIALRDRGYKVSYILADDEGHGFSKPVNNMAMFAAAEKFLAQYCNTHYQPDMPEDVAKRLQQLTVDVSTVKLVQKAKVKAGETLPVPASDFMAGTYNYKTAIAMGGQVINMDVTRSVKEENGQWIINDEAKSAMGNASDTTVYAKGSLVPIKRSLSQGPMKMNIQYQGSDIHMNVVMGGAPKDFPLKAAGPYVSDGPGIDMVIARLPLKEGYTTSFYTDDAMTQKMKQMNLTVTGKETIGGVEATRVELVNADDEADKTILWIDPSKKIATKIEQTLPSLGGAKMTTTLN